MKESNKENLILPEEWGKGPWTMFSDCHSGGNSKFWFEECYIQAGQFESEKLFEEIFNHDPHNVTCECCGPDYSIYVNNDFFQASNFHRQTIYVYKKIEEFIKTKRVCVIYRREFEEQSEIKDFKVYEEDGFMILVQEGK